jgi:hypothetical protein
MKEIGKGDGEQLQKWLKEKHKATLKSSDFREITFPMVRSAEGKVTMKMVSYSTLRVETNEKKRPIDVPILHAYCPFCGVKYD